MLEELIKAYGNTMYDYGYNQACYHYAENDLDYRPDIETAKKAAENLLEQIKAKLKEIEHG